MRDFDLDTWFEIAKKGTTGDMVEDILYSWKNRVTGLSEPQTTAHNKGITAICPKCENKNTVLYCDTCKDVVANYSTGYRANA